MGVSLGNSAISNFKLGSNQVAKVYMGNNLVWPVNFDLTASLKNALVSDRSNNITRTQNITVSVYEPGNSRFKTNLTDISFMQQLGTGNEPWFICQGGEAGILVEVNSVDVVNGWINYGTSYLTSPNFSVGQKVELFNPFINYRYVPSKRPLFDPYPTTVVEGSFHYIQPGGIYQKANGTYVMLCPVVFGAHVSRSIYYATSTDLENWTFVNTKILATNTIGFAKTTGNVFSVGNPFKLQSGNYLVLLAVEQPNGNYTCAYMVINENLGIVTQPTQVGITGWNGTGQNSYPLSIAYFEGKYRLLLHNRANGTDINKEVWELTYTAAQTDANLLAMLNNASTYTTSTRIQQASTGTGYLNGKMDDAEYIESNGTLYMLVGSEQENVGSWVTSNNREYGLAKLVGSSWVHDVRSPMIVNPMQLKNKYPELSFCWDHFGGFITPIIKDGYLYMFLASGDDAPQDYWISGIKTQLLTQ